MALQGNGSDGRLYTSSTIASSGLLTPSFHAWIRNSLAPTTSQTGDIASQVVMVYDSTDAYRFGFTWHHNTASARQSVFHKSSGGTSTDCKLTTSLLADTWYAIGGSYDGSSNLRAWLNGVNETTTGSVNALSNAVSCEISAFANPLSDNYDSSQVMEFAVWDTVLSEAEFLQLSKGVSPLLVKPSSLVSYWPMIRGSNPWVGPATTTAGTISVTNHGRVIYPTDPVYIRHSASTSAEHTLVSLSTSSDFDLNASGEQVTSVSVSGGASLGFSQSTSIALASVSEEISQKALFKSRFSISTGYLASGRHKEFPS